MKISAQYLAGFFDGEGNLRLYSGFSKKSPTSMRAEIAITNNNREILVMIQAQYGGKILERQNTHRTIYRLYWSNLDGIKGLLKIITPYLVVKRRHAELLLEYVSRHNSTDRCAITERDREIAATIASLNSELRYNARYVASL